MVQQNAGEAHLHTSVAIVKAFTTARDVWRWVLPGVLLDHKSTALYRQDNTLYLVSAT